jgi:OOP family OmpA-OmpF porin
MRSSIVLQGIAAVGLALSTTATLADDFKGFYAGAGIATTSLEDDFGLDDRDTGFKLFAGYSFGEQLAIELAYLDGGTVEQVEDVFFFDPPLAGSAFKTEIETKVINLSAIGKFPLTENFSLFGKLGYAAIESDVNLRFISANSFSDTLTDNTDRTEKLSYGAGAVYSFGKNFQLRAEYEGFDVASDLDSLSLSAVFRFR